MEQAAQLLEKHAGAMAHLASALNERPDLDWIYQVACEGLAGTLTIESSFIVLFEEASQSYQLVWALLNGANLPVQRFPVFSAPPIQRSMLNFSVPVVINPAANLPFLQGLDLTPAETPRALVLATLFHEGNKLGILGAGSNTARIFSPEELIRIQTIADQVAAAIVHARLFLAAKKQALYLELTNEITQIALGGGNLQEMLDRLARRVVETLYADGCYISLWDHGRKTLIPFTAYGPNAPAFMNPTAETAPHEAAFVTHSSIYTGELKLPAGSSRPARGSAPARCAYLTLPLQIGKRKLGMIRVEYALPHSFLSASDLPRWEKIASQITLAVTNILAIEQEKKRRHEAELLQQATAAITSSLELQQVLNQILTSLEQVVPFDSAAIGLIEEDFLRIAALGGSAWHSRQVGEKIDRSAGLFALLENARSPVFLGDAQEHPSYEHWSQSGEVVIHGWMGVPLIADDNPIGYLLLNSRERDIYTVEYANLTQAFASQAAVAIEQARLFEQVRNGRERLHALSKKLVEIQEAERRYLAHELHDEIGQELTGLQFMLEMSKDGNKTSRHAALTEAQQLVGGLMSQVRELSLNLHPSMIDDLGLLPALNAHFGRFQQKTGLRVQFNAHNLDARFPAEVEVSAFRVVQESLTNAARYAGVKEMEVNISADETSLRIEIRDRGRGFDTHILQDSSRSFGLSGMRERTELAGGKFEVFSKPGDGTRITAVFPARQTLERRKNDRKSPAG